MSPSSSWTRYDRAWRDPAQIVGQWDPDHQVAPTLLKARTRGRFWELLAEHQITLIVTREYEHLVVGLSAPGGKRKPTYLPIPHPSGLAVDRRRGTIVLASTRNPNQLYFLAPVVGHVTHKDRGPSSGLGRPLVPLKSAFYPGCFYLHDLALGSARLFACATGQNAILALGPEGDAERVWWPRCIETRRGPLIDRNQIQLNSMALGPTIEESLFAASSDRIGRWRPGQLRFPVDGRGVIFCGRTREPIVSGLTRPHSLRFWRNQLWVNNSGYGEVGRAHTKDGSFSAVAKLPGWTRGLCFHRGIAFVGTSRVIPRFAHYAPGLEARESVCGVHAIEVSTGRTIGSIVWPQGNQIFAIDWLPTKRSAGFPFSAGLRGSKEQTRRLFFSYRTPRR